MGIPQSELLSASQRQASCGASRHPGSSGISSLAHLPPSSWQPVRTSVFLGTTEQHTSQLPALTANTSGSFLPALSEGVPAPLPSSGTLFLPPFPILPAGDQIPMSPALKKNASLFLGVSQNTPLLLGISLSPPTTP